MRILVSGYYGYGNTGDEAVLQSMVQGIRRLQPQAEITVLSSSPKLTAEFYKVSSINRYGWLSILRSLLKTDIFISGGGTLFQNFTSGQSLLYYLGLIWLAKLLRRKVMIFAQGFGPLKGWFYRALTRFILNRVDVMSLRDKDSYNQIQRLGVSAPKMVVTADPTLILECPPIAEGEKLLSLEGIKKSGRPLLGISIRSLIRGNSEDFDKIMVKTINWLARERGYVPVFILFQSPQDMHHTSKIVHGVKENTHLIFRICRPCEMLSLFSQFDLFMGMRLHSLVFSLLNAVPMLGISYDPKVESFMEIINQPYFKIDRGLNFDEIKSILENIIKEKEAVSRGLELRKKELYAQAKLNFSLLSDLYAKH